MYTHACLTHFNTSNRRMHWLSDRIWLVRASESTRPICPCLTPPIVGINAGVRIITEAEWQPEVIGSEELWVVMYTNGARCVKCGDAKPNFYRLSADLQVSLAGGINSQFNILRISLHVTM